MTWRAQISYDWPRDTIRLYVGNVSGDGRTDMLCEDGTWRTVDAGVSVEGAGIVLPRPALDAVIEAIREHKGVALDTATEAKVLREWLAAERARVDRLMAAQIDGERDG